MSQPFLAPGQSPCGLCALLHAFDLCQDVVADIRFFAVELSVLVNSGLSANQLRWLALKGYAEHYIERKPRGNERRSLVVSDSLNLLTHSRFVLTAAGADFARSICRSSERQNVADNIGDDGNKAVTRNAPEPEPHWDRGSRQLTFGGALIKTFSRAARTQMPVLDKFEAANWNGPIDASEFVLGRSRRKDWLHETINSLNDGHLIRKIHFCADGPTNGIGWMLASPLPRRKRKPRRRHKKVASRRVGPLRNPKRKS